MSMIRVRTGSLNNKKARAKHQIMANSGFGEVRIIQEGERKLDTIGLYCTTVEEAMRLYNKSGLATVAV